MDEPIHVTNIKKAIVANLNMDISASRRAEINSNSVQVSFSNIIFLHCLPNFQIMMGFIFLNSRFPMRLSWNKLLWAKPTLALGNSLSTVFMISDTP